MIYGRAIFKVVHALFLFETSVMRFFFCFVFLSAILTSFIILKDFCVRFFVGKQFD